MSPRRETKKLLVWSDEIDTVMANQADLVAVEHTLSQIFNYKG